MLVGALAAGTPWAAALVPPEALPRPTAPTSGRAVDATRLQFYEVLAIVKMIAIMLTGIRPSATSGLATSAWPLRAPASLPPPCCPA